MIICHGGNTGGHTLFIKDRKLHYVHNVGAQEMHIESREHVPEGNVTLRYQFEPTGGFFGAPGAANLQRKKSAEQHEGKHGGAAMEHEGVSRHLLSEFRAKIVLLLIGAEPSRAAYEKQRESGVNRVTERQPGCRTGIEKASIPSRGVPGCRRPFGKATARLLALPEGSAAATFLAPEFRLIARKELCAKRIFFAKILCNSVNDLS